MQDSGGQDPDQSDLQRWAEMPDDGLTMPILADPGGAVANRFERDGGIPTYSLIGRNMELLVVDGFPSDGVIQSALDEDWPEVEWDQPPDLDDAEAVVSEGASEAPEVEAGPFGGGDSGDAGLVAPFGGGGSGCSYMAAGSAAGLLSLLPLAAILRRRT